MNDDLFSLNNQYKVSISTGMDGNLRVSTSKWTHEIVPGVGEVCDPYWEVVSGPSITDTLEAAIAIARDEFRRLTGVEAYKTEWTKPES
jgi:hypothetical protein